MFSSLKEKILSVSLFNIGNEKQPQDKVVINLNAGAEILQHFEKQWKELHKTNEENAENAEKVAKEIECISNQITANKTNLELINHKLLNSKLAVNISNCLTTLNDVYKTAETIEYDLIKLENLIDEAHYQELKREHEYHLDQYKLRKEESLESFKKSLQEEHAKKVSEYEASRKHLHEERQRVFQDAFKTDLELYKSLGTIPEVDHSKNKSGALLEEIQIDYDQSELEKFFDDD